MPPAQPAPDLPGSDHPGDGSTREFWIVGIGFITLMALTTLPTPLYPLYQQRDGFNTFTITLIFAVYGVGVMLGLYLLGHVSDWLGRRRVLIASTLVELAACLLFVLRHDTASLLVGRLVCGLGIGAITSTGTAYLTELRQRARPGEDAARGRMVATATNNLGLAVGPLLAGVLAEFAPHPLVLPYLVDLVALLVLLVVLRRMPETVEVQQPAPRWHPQRIAVQREHRGAYLSAALGALAGFSVTGFCTALSATYLSRELHISSHLVSGLLVFAILAASPLAQVACSRLAHPRRVRLGRGCMVAGLVLVLGSAWHPALWLFAAGGIVAVWGVGLVFNGAVETGMDAADDEARSSGAAGIFLAAYLGMTLPVVGVGSFLQFFAIAPVMAVFAVVVACVVVLATGLQLRHDTIH